MVETNHVDLIAETSGTIYGRIPNDSNVDSDVDYNEKIVEYGFLYSHKVITDDDLIYGTTDVSSVTIETFSSGSGKDVSSLSGYDSSNEEVLYSTDLTNLDPRQYVYYRAYIKSEDMGVGSPRYVYGEVKRFITEKRDFSAKANGGCVVVDLDNTKKNISNWDGDQSFSLELWVKRDRNSTEEVILKNHHAGYKLMFNSSDNLVFDYTTPTSSNAITSSVAISDTEWHHIAVTCDNSSTLIYIDGVLTSTTGTIPGYTAPDETVIGYLFVGAEGVSEDESNSGEGKVDNPFFGYLDCVRFWSKKLTEDQVKILLYDNVMASNSSNTQYSVVLKSRPDYKITGITFDNLTASFGFNVESVLENPKSTVEFPFVYSTQGSRLDYNFFHEDSRTNDDNTENYSYNIVAIGDIDPSVVIPRVNWRNNNSSASWFTPDNWSGYAYPGQGIISTEALSTNFEDIVESTGTTELESDAEYCKYSVINLVQSGKEKPKVSASEAKVQTLVDLEAEVKSYSVDGTQVSTMTIHDGIQKEIKSENVKINSGVIKIEEGSVEVK